MSSATRSCRGGQLLAEELNELNASALARITAGPEEDDILIWRAYVIGEEGSPFDGGLFTMRLVFSEDWPEVWPEVRFLTSTFHPGIHPETGRTSLAAMGLVRGSKEKVSERSCNGNDNPASPLTLRTILDAAVHFFTKSAYLQQTRTSNCIFNKKAAAQIAKDLRGFEETATRWTYAYAK